MQAIDASVSVQSDIAKAGSSSARLAPWTLAWSNRHAQAGASTAPAPPPSLRLQQAQAQRYQPGMNTNAMENQPPPAQPTIDHVSVGWQLDPSVKRQSIKRPRPARPPRPEGASIDHAAVNSCLHPAPPRCPAPWPWVPGRPLLVGAMRARTTVCTRSTGRRLVAIGPSCHLQLHACRCCPPQAVASLALPDPSSMALSDTWASQRARANLQPTTPRWSPSTMVCAATRKPRKSEPEGHSAALCAELSCHSRRMHAH